MSGTEEDRLNIPPTPLSNFVADALNVVGFDPVERFVDFILRRAEAA
jgi:hypothetical protein